VVQRAANVIKRISIHNYKSFHPTTPAVIDIDTSKQATFIYGLNGAGKSAIGEVIHGRSVNDQAFAHCQVETTGTGPFRYLVYNHVFVSRVIGETMQGIFTIGELDTTKQKEIEKKEAENVILEAELAKLNERVETARKHMAAQITRGVEDVWRAHSLGKKTKLAELLMGYGKDKKKFFEDLRKSAVDTTTPLDTMERLEQRWDDASGTEISKSAPQVDLTGLAEIETDSIWAEAIEVSATSRLAPLIAKLGNGDWVDEGRGYVKDDQCPFCQQGLSHDFKEELAKLLEGGRKLKIDKIEGLVSNYALRLERIQERMKGVFDDAITKDTGLELAWSKLEGLMKANLTLMRAKQARPRDPVMIKTADHHSMVSALATVKAKVDDFNQRINDRSSERAKIRTMFYEFLYADRAEAYANHDAAIASLNTQLEAERVSAERVADQISANTVCLAELRQSQTGVDASVEAINTRLRDLGIDSFWIKPKKGDGHLYCLVRPNDADCTTQSLSEGEKTLISFLYFMELIKGTHEEHGTVDIGKTIVVIDDPISSLSQNFIYDVATIIQHHLIKPPDGVVKVRQVIVLTHNLFFFHEVVHQLASSKLANAHRKCQMLRIHKGEYTIVKPLDPTVCMNDYDALWQVLRDAKENQALVQVVPNTMRCILEQFFTFTAGIDDFDEALEKLSVQDLSHKFKALHRYLNRGSHKNGINGPPMDWSQYDVPYYLAKLRALLKEAGHEHHYLRKMGEEATTAEVRP
jgi:wobble nucleotide-excising tRNase